MKLSDIVKMAVCTCCDKRANEIKYIQNICKIIGLEVKIFIGGNGQNNNLQYDFIDNSQNSIWQNQYDFHKVAIKWAYEQKFDHILFLEDDITICKDFWSVLSKVNVPENYDQINLGGLDYYKQEHDINSINNPHLSLCTMLGGFFGSLINGKNLEYLYSHKHYDGLPGYSFDPEQINLPIKFNKYILSPRIIVERKLKSIIHDYMFPHDAYEQALRENRLFTDEEVYNYK